MAQDLVILLAILYSVHPSSAQTDDILPHLRLSNNVTILFNQTTFLDFFNCLTMMDACSCEMKTDNFVFYSMSANAGMTTLCNQRFNQTVPAKKQVCRLQVYNSGPLQQRYVEIICLPIADSCSALFRATHNDCFPVCWNGTITGELSRPFGDYDECFLRFPPETNRTKENINEEMGNDSTTDSSTILIGRSNDGVSTSMMHSEQYMLTPLPTKTQQSRDTSTVDTYSTTTLEVHSPVTLNVDTSSVVTGGVVGSVSTVKHLSESTTFLKQDTIRSLNAESQTISLQKSLSPIISLKATSQAVSLQALPQTISLQAISPTTSLQAKSQTVSLHATSTATPLQAISPTVSLQAISPTVTIQASVSATPTYRDEKSTSQQKAPIETSFTSLVRDEMNENGYRLVSTALSTVTDLDNTIEPVVATPDSPPLHSQYSEIFLVTSPVISAEEMTSDSHPNATSLSERSGDIQTVIIIPCVVIGTFLIILTVIIYCIIRHRRQQVKAIATTQRENNTSVNTKAREASLQSRFAYLAQSSKYQNFNNSHNSKYGSGFSTGLSTSSKRHLVDNEADHSNGNILRSESHANEFYASQIDLKHPANHVLHPDKDVLPYAVATLVEIQPAVKPSNGYFALSDSSNSSSDSGVSKVHSNLSSDECETVSASNSFQYLADGEHERQAESAQDNTFLISKVKRSSPYTKLGDVHRSIENIYDSQFV
ncbi:hypothetical protein Btru_055739 [Bulinus truncatus]|nr:hypothetical protein Btru_055739 [Bulinus truncatus]